MTDKHIIIDGVDVSGCVTFKYDGIKKPLCRAGDITSVYKSCLCAGNTDCYYKQLKRKEQALDEIENNILEYQALILGKPITMRENDCIYNILDIINKAKENKCI